MIHFEQVRRYSNWQDVGFDIDVAYEGNVMTAGPYMNLGMRGNPRERTALYAKLDAGSGKFNLEVRSWEMSAGRAQSSKLGLRDWFAQKSGSVEYVGSCASFDEAKLRLEEFEKKCEQEGRSLVRTPGWVPHYFRHARPV